MAEGSADRIEELGDLVSHEINPGTRCHSSMTRCSGVNVIGRISGQNVTLTANVTRQITEEDWTNQKIQMIHERTLSRIQLWTKDMVRTSALEKVLDKLDKGTRWLTIKGSPGEGKTTCAYMALEELHRRGRQVFQVLTPDEYLEVTRNPSQSVIMLDDILGDLEFDELEWIKWKAVLRTTLEALEHRSHQQREMAETVMNVVLLVGRDYVLNSASRDLGKFSDLITHEKHVIEMSQRVKRDFEEKMNIWNALIKFSDIKVNDRDILKICSMKIVHGFPHVCRLFVTAYSENTAISVVSYFEAPLQFLNKTIEKLLDDDQKLALFKEIIKGNGKISTRELGRLDDNFRIIKRARDMVGTYLKMEGDYFMFDHPSVYDCVAYNLLKLYPLFVIEKCELSFIHQRLRLQKGHTESTRCETQLVVHIPRAYLRDLAQRFAGELQSSHLFYTLTHVVCTDREFVEQMMSVVSMLMTRLLNLTDKESGEQFLILITQNRSSELFRYIEANTGIKNNQTAINTVFHGVCMYASSKLLTYMLEIGCVLDINARTFIPRFCVGGTFAMLAATTKDPEFVDQILNLFPDLNAVDGYRKTLLHYLCSGHLVSAVERVIEICTAVHSQSDVGIPNPHLNCRDSVGYTPLHEAADNGSAECVNALVKAGADVNAKSDVDKSYITPLDKAVDRKFKECVDVLVKAGAEVNLQDIYGFTPLYRAARIGAHECMAVLLKAGAEADVQCEDGSTLLHILAGSGVHECLEMLQRAGLDINAQRKDGSTPLHTSVERAPETCVALLKAGADVNRQNDDGYTPLQKARKRYSELSKKERLSQTEMESKSNSKMCVDVLMKAGGD